MALDVRGSLKNTKLSRNPFVVFEELVSNAIDSVLIRRSSDASAPSLSVKITIDFDLGNLLGDDAISISCHDNGCGLGDEQLTAFLTKDTSYKDDLTITGIGSCKGSGRIQFFHHFNGMTIDSIYQSDGQKYKRKLRFSAEDKLIRPENFSTQAVDHEEVGTSINLYDQKVAALEAVSPGANLRELYSVKSVRDHIYFAFMQRFVSLGDKIGNFEISFQLVDGDEMFISTIKYDDLPDITKSESLEIAEIDCKTGERLGSVQDFLLNYYKLPATEFDLPENVVAFSANSVPVRDFTARYFRTKAEKNNPLDGYFHIFIIESSFLDSKVNEQRDDFDGIQSELPIGDLFCDDRISYAEIFEVLDPAIEALVGPMSWTREDIVKKAADEFGVSESMIQETSTRVRYGDTAQSVAERVLVKYQEQIIEQTADLVRLKSEVISISPDADDFRTKVSELSWRFTSYLRSIDMANLSQLVVRRATMVEILDLAVRGEYESQKVEAGQKRKDEQIIHNIFFPMRKDSDDQVDHDIWLLGK